MAPVAPFCSSLAARAKHARPSPRRSRWPPARRTAPISAATWTACRRTEDYSQVPRRTAACSAVLGKFQPREIVMPQAQETPSAVKGGIVAYLSLDGAVRAGEFYSKAFDARQVFVQPPDGKGRTMHVHLHVNGASLM